ncbi:hypothetical protein [Nonomuraea fuscirosea]|uniref:hypothetical protein n=1 Tax=Nonomuraea fuscirosea TaxID=1291556 RepID=UPI0034333491
MRAVAMAGRLVEGLTPGEGITALGLVEEILTSGLGRVKLDPSVRNSRLRRAPLAELHGNLIRLYHLRRG